MLNLSTNTPHHAMIYYVCRMTDDFQWEGLRSTTEEDYAYTMAEFFSEKYPHAHIDVLTHSEFHGVA